MSRRNHNRELRSASTLDRLSAACMEALEGRTYFGYGPPNTALLPSPSCPTCPAPPTPIYSNPNTGQGGTPTGGAGPGPGMGGGDKKSDPGNDRTTGDPVVYGAGTPIVNSTDLISNAFGHTWGQVRSWVGLNDASLNGNGWMVTDLPFINVEKRQVWGSHATLQIVISGGSMMEFDVPNSGTAFTARGTTKATLVYTPPITDGSGNKLPGEFKLTDEQGNITTFYDLARGTTVLTDANGKKYGMIDGSANYMQQDTKQWFDTTTGTGAQTATNRYRFGAFKSYTDAAGQYVVTTNYDTSTGNLTSVVRTDGSGAFERFYYQYSTVTNSTTGASASLVSSVSLQKGSSSGGPWTTERAAEYSYYTGDGSDSANGRLGDLKLVTIKDYLKNPGSPETVDQKYYRYYKFHNFLYFNNPNGPTNKFTASNDTLSGGTGGTDTTFSAQTISGNADNAVMSGLKMVVEGANLSRLAANYASYTTLADVDTVSGTDSNGDGDYNNDEVRSYANNFFRYERYLMSAINTDQHASTGYRVTEESAAGAGCSTCSGGIANTKLVISGNANWKIDQFDVTDSVYGTNSADLNKWALKTIEYRSDETNADANHDGVIDSTEWDDNDQNIVYTNEIGQPILKVLLDKNGTTSSGDDKQYLTFYHYDANARVDYVLSPSALSGYSESQLDLIDFTNNSLFYISLYSGRIDHYTYATSTTATTSTAGNVSGYLQSYSVRAGLLGSDVAVYARDYIKHSYGGYDLFKVADETKYFDVDNNGSDDAVTTAYAYTWQLDGSSVATNKVKSQTITLPTVNSSRNGSGSSTSKVTFYDVEGRPVWKKDADGFITYTKYDDSTGAIVKQITDVNTSNTSDFSNLPSGWSTPGSGGLHLITTMVVDPLGRTTKLTDPNGNVTYTVYNDGDHEVRTYRGWNATTGTATGPIEVTREYRPASGASSGQRTDYIEYLTTSATPSTSGSSGSYVPTGTETISAGNIQSLSRALTNDAGQITENDAYFSMSGITYSQATAQLGSSSNDSASGNYHASKFAYDGQNRVKKTVTPAGTITRYLYDARRLMLSKWVGTDDTPSSGFWSPSNTTGTDLVKVEDAEYDKDGNRITDTKYPGGGATARVTRTAYDFRGRAVLVKQGDEASESSSVNRLLNYYTYNNQGQITAVEQYDGDGLVGTLPAAISITNNSFESGSTGWTFSGGSSGTRSGGVDGSTEAWFVTSPFGSHATVSQSVSNWTAGSKTISFYGAIGSNTQVLVKVDGTTVGTFTDVTGSNDWSLYTTAPITATSGTHTILFEDVAVGMFQTGFMDLDAIAINDVTTTPAAPTSSARRAKTTYSYDDQGRIFRSSVFSVDQSTGSVSSDALKTDTWYDARGDVMKTSVPGGLVTKTTTDGAGRINTTYQSNGGGDSVYGDADDVTGDTVLEQTNTTYDSNGNPILVITKQRFHDDTVTGALGDASTTPKARVSYSANYFDAANRLTDSVNFGTNGGTLDGAGSGADLDTNNNSVADRPSSVPSRSDKVLVASYSFDSAGRVYDVTDARGLVTRTTYDALGRTAQTIAGYTDGTPSAGDDQTTQYTYDGSDHVLTMKAVLPSSAFQTTQWVYGVTSGGGSDINSNDLLASVKYPDKSSGSASSGEQENYRVNALGQVTRYTDRNGNVHDYSYDVMGRLTTDNVGTLGSGVDGSVRKLIYTYNTQGLPEKFTSYDNSSAVVNELQRAYNGLGQLTTEYQAHGGAVNTGSSPKVQYAYSEMASSANHSRLKSVTYPNGRIVRYEYGTSSNVVSDAVNDSISRLTYLADDSSGSIGTHLEEYEYLGLSTVVAKVRPQSGVNLTYIKDAGDTVIGDAGDQYKGLDRFGRIIDQRWTTSTPTDKDRNQYSYDRDSNVLYKDNTLSNSFDELYHADGASNGYDSLNRLVEFQRGSLSDANSDGVPDTVTTASASQVYSMDAVGNWSSLTTNGGSAVNRTHNKQNQVTQVASNNLTFDSNGNATVDENGQKYTYDAWNRLVIVKDSGNNTIATYASDALGRRVKLTYSSTSSDLYYSSNWQVLEERNSGGNATTQYVWSPTYVDDLVERDRDSDANGSLEERLFVEQDVNHNVTSLTDTGGNVVERFAYDPYGSALVLDNSWTPKAGNASGYAWRHMFQGLRYDNSSGLYNSRERDLSTTLGRFLERDPIGSRETMIPGKSQVALDAEQQARVGINQVAAASDQLWAYTDGMNSYQFVGNEPTTFTDPSGMDRYISGSGIHQGVAVDLWLFDPKTRTYKKIGVRTYDFSVNYDCMCWWARMVIATPGHVSSLTGVTPFLASPITQISTPQEDIAMYQWLEYQARIPDLYSVLGSHTCRDWASEAMQKGRPKEVVFPDYTLTN